MKKLSLENLDDLAIGSSILGSGGGGDPDYYYRMARHEIEKYQPVSLINPSELSDDDLIFPVGFTGAPLVQMEKIPSGREFLKLFNYLEESEGRKANIVMPFEIGGGNAFAPFLIAAQLNIPVLDADLMGRAFPESQMTSWHLFAATKSSAFITDCRDNASLIHAKNTHLLEKIGRQITVAMGSSGVYGFYPISGKQASKCVIHKSVSKAIAIGKSHREAKKKGKDPLEATVMSCKGVCLGSGRIEDIDRFVNGGFSEGVVVIQNENEKIELMFQNEFLLAKVNDQVAATTPDVLMLLEQETGTPIGIESLQFGLKVHLIAFPSSDIWTTPQGLELVGPRHFGYEISYRPIQ
jgi:uncharacterized protein